MLSTWVDKGDKSYKTVRHSLSVSHTHTLTHSSSASEHACSGDSSIKVHATNQESSWFDTSDLTDDDALNDVMKSYLGVTYPTSELSIEIEDVIPGAEYVR